MSSKSARLNVVQDQLYHDLVRIADIRLEDIHAKVGCPASSSGLACLERYHDPALSFHMEKPILMDDIDKHLTELRAKVRSPH